MGLASRLLVVAFAGVLALGSIARAAEPGKRPNIVYIMADDLGWTDLACYGSKYYETPNIDKLAAQGTRFTDGYTCGPNCQPTRAALLTGQYGPRTGVYTVGNIYRFNWQTRPLKPVANVMDLPLEKTTFAQQLQKAGYKTAMFGKWHLGPKTGPHGPAERGFGEAIESSGKHFDFETTPHVDVPKGAYLADFLTDRAVDFITRHKDEPFFLYLPHFGVHGPHQAKAELIEKFKKKEGAGGPAVGGHNDPTYAAMIYSVDESVGRVIKTLEDLKLAENTLVVFTSDNGGVGGYPSAGVNIGGITDNAPLKGGKGTLYEGGVRVPFIFRWPGKIEAGTTSDTPIISVDLFPTMMELTGAKAPENQPLDGVSIVSLLTEKTPVAERDLYWHFPGYLGAAQNQWRTTPVGAVRSGDFKLLEFFEDGKLELYDLKNDLGQKHDLAKEKPDVAKALHEKLVAWRETVGAKMPTPITEEDKTAAKKAGRKRPRGAAAAQEEE